MLENNFVETILKPWSTINVAIKLHLIKIIVYILSYLVLLLIQEVLVLLVNLVDPKVNLKYGKNIIHNIGNEKCFVQ